MSVNKAIIVGYLGKDPETRYTNSGDAVANFSVATSESWKDKAGERQERTEWHRITVFGKLAEICGQYLTKGKLVYLEGKITTRKWTDKEGVEKYTTEIVCDTMKMLGKREDGGGREAGSDDERPAKSKPAAKKAAQGDGVTDNIPFN